MQSCTNEDWVKTKAWIYSRGFIQNLFCIFMMFMQIFMNFGSLYEFLEIFNQITDFRNGKCMNSIRLETSPRPAALRPCWPTTA
jgi:hypothetical protein